MFDEVDEIIRDYGWDDRPAAESLYNRMYALLQDIEAEIGELSEELAEPLLADMESVARKMQELNYAVCQFEHKPLTDLAGECPPRHAYDKPSGGVPEDSEKRLAEWLRLHFPDTWPS